VLAGTAMPGLQINPTQLHFCAAAGADAPVTLTLFNPHPVERVAFKVGRLAGVMQDSATEGSFHKSMHESACLPLWVVLALSAARTAQAGLISMRQQIIDGSALPFLPQIKTTASSTYRVWPNSGALEAGETARVQVLLLGTKVDLADPLRVDECRRDRFQVSSFNNQLLLTLHAGGSCRPLVICGDSEPGFRYYRYCEGGKTAPCVQWPMSHGCTRPRLGPELSNS